MLCPECNTPILDSNALIFCPNCNYSACNCELCSSQDGIAKDDFKIEPTFNLNEPELTKKGE